MSMSKAIEAGEIASISPVRTATPEPDNNSEDAIASSEEHQHENDGTPLARTETGPPYSIFSPKTKLFIVFSVSLSALISPFAATSFYPALNVLAQQLHVSASLVNLSITTYMIAQAIAPALLASISDSGGRRLSFIICFSIYIVANIGLALQTNYAALLVLRCVQAAGSSGTIALAIATVADVSTSTERGKYMGYATGGILVGPAIGPTLGGALAEYLGWRSIFWFLAIFGGVLFIVFLFFFPETCRNVVGNGSIPARGVNLSIIGYYQQKKRAGDVESQTVEKPKAPNRPRKWNVPNPLATLAVLRDKESACVLLYNGFFFLGQMVVSAALPYMLEQAYGYDELEVGLCFISLGMGCLLSALTMGHVVDWNFRRHAALVGLEIPKGKQPDLRNYPIETARLQVVIPNHALGTISLIIFGWTIKYRTHVSGPLIMLFFIGVGISTAFNTTNTLLIDLHRDKAATATAAVNFVRCMISAGGVAAIVPMIKAMNPGWAFTFIGLLYVVLMPVLWVMMAKGQGWRDEVARKKEAKEKMLEAASNTANESSEDINSPVEEKPKT